jgi:hypothetical protein
MVKVGRGGRSIGIRQETFSTDSILQRSQELHDFFIYSKSPVMKNECNEAKAQFTRWAAAQRKELAKQKMKVVSRTQSAVPKLALAMQNYESTSQHQSVLCHKIL